jgi:hypothetical protein
MRISSRGIAKQILNSGLLSRDEILREWARGSESGRAWVICNPLGPPPKSFLDNSNGEKLLAPPSAPF